MTTPVIANTVISGYAQPKTRRARAVVMGADERADLEKRVRAGEWLKTGSVAKLLGMSRTKAHNMVTSGEIRHRKMPGGTQRECDPRDVLRLLEERQRVYRGEEPAPVEQPPTE